MARLKPNRRAILIVDDDSSYRSLLSTIFTGSAFEVSTAEDGQDALRILDTGEDYDLIITDLQMPNVDGVSLIEALQDRRPTIPIIVMSAFLEDERYQNMKPSRELSCLMKPFRLAEVLTMARSLLKDSPSVS